MIINFKQTRILVASTKAGALTLVPGVNVIPDATWKEVEADFKDRIGKDIVVVTKEKKGPGGKDISAPVQPWELEAAEAEKLLVDTFSVPVLKAWLDNESRESVRAAIYRRITELEAATAPK